MDKAKAKMYSLIKGMMLVGLAPHVPDVTLDSSE
jgi:hypothetical protein